VPGGVDAVIDLALAGFDLARSAAAVRTGGLVVSPRGGPALFDHGVVGVYTGVTLPEGRLEGFAAQAAAGRLQVPIAVEYAFEDVRRAVIDFPQRHLRGKAVVVFPERAIVKSCGTRVCLVQHRIDLSGVHAALSGVPS
jgi:hypothetical protein